MSELMMHILRITRHLELSQLLEGVVPQSLVKGGVSVLVHHVQLGTLAHQQLGDRKKLLKIIMVLEWFANRFDDFRSYHRLTISTLAH